MRARIQSADSLGRYSTVMLSLFVGLLAFPIGCAAERDGSLRAITDEGWQSWQILETQTGRVVPFPEFITNLKQYDIVYLREEHHNPYHIQAALKVLDQQVADGIEPTIGLEMFGWDGQPALDSYVATTQSVTNEFLEQVRWKQNWGGAFEDYAPLVTFARDRHLSVRAMNPPRPLIGELFFGLIDGVIDLLEVDFGGDIEGRLRSHPQILSVPDARHPDQANISRST